MSYLTRREIVKRGSDGFEIVVTLWKKARNKQEIVIDNVGCEAFVSTHEAAKQLLLESVEGALQFHYVVESTVGEGYLFFPYLRMGFWPQFAKEMYKEFKDEKTCIYQEADRRASGYRQQCFCTRC